MTAPVFRNAPSPTTVQAGTNASAAGGFKISSQVTQHHSIKVAVRLRPLAEGPNKSADKRKNKNADKRAWTVDRNGGRDTLVQKGLTRKAEGRTIFHFDKVFDEDTQTPLLYESIARPMVRSVLNGKHATIFAYGQTGSGKTFTMQGDGQSQRGQAGIIQLVASDLFRFMKQGESARREFKVLVSYFELYNEKIRDLLSGDRRSTVSRGSHGKLNTSSGSGSEEIKIRANANGEIVMEVTQPEVSDVDEVLELLVEGNARRVVAPTDMNEHSSRSHAVFRLTVESRNPHEPFHLDSPVPEVVRVADFNLVDLAGSECVKMNSNSTLVRQRETRNINTSLLALTSVIQSLSLPPKKRPKHITYRESKLTRILQPHLSGNAEMAILCCVSPSKVYTEETRSTLKFAARAKLVEMKPKVNEVLDDSLTIKKLQDELADAKKVIDDLRIQLQHAEEHRSSSTMGESSDDASLGYEYVRASVRNAGRNTPRTPQVEDAAQTLRKSSSHGNDLNVVSKHSTVSLKMGDIFGESESFTMISRMMRSTTSTATSMRTSLFVLLLSILCLHPAASWLAPELPFGDINFLVVSDVHSFVGGHPHEPDRNADYGDLLSFKEQLQPYCVKMQKDCWLVNNGDFLHGTGLAMDGNATSLLPIIGKMPWDAMNMGNHEAMYSAVLHDMRELLLPSLPGRYLTSNVLWKETMEPFGVQYQLLKGNYSTALMFGFMYEMENPSETVEVLRISDVVEQDWFIDALNKEKYDAIVVMAHMDQEDELVDDLYHHIRSHVDEKMPIQFITGHSHKRLYTNRIKKDHYVSKIEPGGLFDTIGFVSLPNFTTAEDKPVGEMENEFGHEFLNTSKMVLKNKLYLTHEDDNLRTPHGEQVSYLIDKTRIKLGLDQVVACPGRDYFRNVSVYDEKSLWRLWREHVIPSQLFVKGESRLMLVGKDTFRYDLRGSGKHDAMVLDDIVAIAPYMEKVIYIGEVPDWMVRRLNQTLNTFSAHSLIPDFVLAGEIESYKTVESFKLYTHEVDVPVIVAKLKKYNFQDLKLTSIGKRSTIYWLDYVMSAMPCDGRENVYDVVPYFYDPTELEEEISDGFLSEDVKETDDNFVPGANENPKEEPVWTLPPDGGYSGYVPGEGDAHKIPSSKYDDYEEPDPNTPKHSSLNDRKSRIERRKKRQKAVVRGIALMLATAMLLFPVICGVMQLTGRWKDDDDDIGFYDREEVRSLRRHRRRGGGGAPPQQLTDMRPVGEIEII